jgi:hypothetical protein
MLENKMKKNVKFYQNSVELINLKHFTSTHFDEVLHNNFGYLQ